MTLKMINAVAAVASAEVLREILDYNPETGEMVWLERPVNHFPSGRPTPEHRAAMWNGKYSGKPALTSMDKRGYYRGAIGGKNVYAHRAALALAYGEWPQGEVDHINRDKSDNRLCNLREVTHSENRRNSDSFDAAMDNKILRGLEASARRAARKKRYPISGIRRDGNKWQVRIKRNGVEEHVGMFSCFADAVSARLMAELL